MMQDDILYIYTRIHAHNTQHIIFNRLWQPQTKGRGLTKGGISNDKSHQWAHTVHEIFNFLRLKVEKYEMHLEKQRMVDV